MIDDLEAAASRREALTLRLKATDVPLMLPHGLANDRLSGATYSISAAVWLRRGAHLAAWRVAGGVPGNVSLRRGGVAMPVQGSESVSETTRTLTIGAAQLFGLTIWAKHADKALTISAAPARTMARPLAKTVHSAPAAS